MSDLFDPARLSRENSNLLRQVHMLNDKLSNKDKRIAELEEDIKELESEVESYRYRSAADE